MRKSNFWKITFLIQSCITILLTSYFLIEVNKLKTQKNIKEDTSIKNIRTETAIEADFVTIAKAAEMRLDTSDFKELIQQQERETKTAFTNRLLLQYYDIYFDSTGKLKTINSKSANSHKVVRCCK